MTVSGVATTLFLAVKAAAIETSCANAINASSQEAMRKVGLEGCLGTEIVSV